MMNETQPLLTVRNLKKYFPMKAGMFRKGTPLKAVDDVSFDLETGKTLGLVGESGCGKSTLGRAILRLHEPTSGEVILDSKPVTGVKHGALMLQRRKMQIIFQDPYASLNPRRTVYQTVREPLDIHKVGDPKERRHTVEILLERVGLRRQVMDRYPHEFSGGQRQRVGIARALALNPKFIVADEPVSALDVSVQSQVLNLIADLQKDMGIAFLFISHDLAVVQHVSDHVAVMYLGKLVELGPADRIYKDPRHPYTQALLSAIPNPDPKHRKKHVVLSGDVPSPVNPPSGCPFHTRCPRVMDICKKETPVQTNQGNATNPHLVSCHLYS